MCDALRRPAKKHTGKEASNGSRCGVVKGEGGGQLSVKLGAQSISQLHGSERVQAGLHQRMVSLHRAAHHALRHCHDLHPAHDHSM